MEKFLRGDAYPQLSAESRRAIDDIADELEILRELGQETIVSGQIIMDIIDDPEAPCTIAHDRGLLEGALFEEMT